MKRIILIFLCMSFSNLTFASIVGVSPGGQQLMSAVTVQEDSPTNTIQQGFNEKQNVLLTTNLNYTGGTIASGTRVDSHLIFLNTEEGTKKIDTTAVWKFSGDILGIMSNGNGSDFMNSNTLFGDPNNFTIGTNTGTFNGFGLEGNDEMSFTGNTLELRMLVTEPGDWIRVVTASAVPLPAAVWLMGSGLVGLIGYSRKNKQQVVNV
ncbi:MAG: hypothetical protein methR_P0953 [Methyloprofundus sp.]|nr:MAG: hypothetical protein methR_P0953 [Methyloprofundus sp.]